MPNSDPEKRKLYAREWVKKRRTEFFSDKKCEWCGSTDNLVLHHSDPKEKVASAIWSWSESRRDEELAKCVVLCKICHNKYHAELRRKFTHGRNIMYTRWGCRCKLCYQAHCKVDKRRQHLVE
jgi:hypothetical protein